MILEASDRLPLEGDDGVHGLADMPETGDEASNFIGDDDLSQEQHLRLLMKLLHQAVSDQLEGANLQPTCELETAMANVKAELDWW